MEAVRATFRPEFLNRLDEILLFRRLSRDKVVPVNVVEIWVWFEAVPDQAAMVEIWFGRASISGCVSSAMASVCI
jgi:ATP-dependent Clp protease ATP-binding subunit ClpB